MGKMLEVAGAERMQDGDGKDARCGDFYDPRSKTHHAVPCQSWRRRMGNNGGLNNSGRASLVIC